MYQPAVVIGFCQFRMQFDCFVEVRQRLFSVSGFVIQTSSVVVEVSAMRFLFDGFGQVGNQRQEELKRIVDEQY